MKTTLALFVSGLVLMVAATGYYISANPPVKTQELPIIGSVKEFELINTKKVNFNSNDLKDKVWVASFFFTSCPGICPLVNAKLSKIHERYKNNEDFRLVSITVDPMRDGPTALKEYAESIKADTNYWYFLTGNNDYVKEVVEKRFLLPGADLPSAHSDRVVLVDTDFNIRGYYSGTDDESMSKLVKDLSNLL